MGVILDIAAAIGIVMMIGLVVSSFAAASEMGEL